MVYDEERYGFFDYHLEKFQNENFTVDDDDFVELDKNYSESVSIDSTRSVLENCKRELDRVYPDDTTPLYCTKSTKRDQFLTIFSKRLKSCLAYDPNDPIESNLGKTGSSAYFPLATADEYEANFEVLVNSEHDYKLMTIELLDENSLGYFFNKILKILGFVLKIKPVSESFTSRITHDSVQETFSKAVDGHGRSFLVIFFKTPEKDIFYENVVLDDVLFSSMIEVLAENLKVDQMLGNFRLTLDSNIKTPCCFKVVELLCTKLEEVMDFSHLSLIWKTFILYE